MTRRDHPLLTAVGLLVLFGALVAVASGALLTFAAERLFRLRLDVGQRWTWAIASSVVVACVMCCDRAAAQTGSADTCSWP